MCAMISTPESAYAKELAKWEPSPAELAERMTHPKPYPKMLYKGKRSEGGPVTYETMVVTAEEELHRMASRGWVQHPDEAIKAFEHNDRVTATAEAHRAYEDRSMSEGARREAKAYEATTDEHVPEIPRRPIRKRGRPVKKAAPQTEE